MLSMRTFPTRKQTATIEDRDQTDRINTRTYSNFNSDLDLRPWLQSLASYSYVPYTCKNQGQRSVGSKARVETVGRTDMTDCSTLPEKRGQQQARRWSFINHSVFWGSVKPDHLDLNDDVLTSLWSCNGEVHCTCHEESSSHEPDEHSATSAT